MNADGTFVITHQSDINMYFVWYSSVLLFKVLPRRAVRRFYGMYKNKMIMCFCGVIYLMVYFFLIDVYIWGVFFPSLKFFVYNAFVAFLQLVNKDISITLFYKKLMIWRTIGPGPRSDAFKLESSCTIYWNST